MAAVRLLRHATLDVELAGRRLLVDPMLAAAGAHPPVENTPNQQPNPLVDLPSFDLDVFDAVLVTHTHRDHLDEAVRDALDLPVYCAPPDEADVAADFDDVRPVDDAVEVGDLTVHRVPARHGHGDLAERMAPSSGYVLDGETTLYLTGDTVPYDGVEETLAAHDPDVAVANAGAAQFTEGRPITMTPEGVAALGERVPTVAVHMEAINHCLSRRDDLRDHLESRDLADRVTVPADVERVTL